MTDRYFGKVVALRDAYSVVINRGAVHGVENGQKFLIVGLGEVIFDPDTNEELEQLEIVRGQVSAEHVQEKISTLKSCQYTQEADVREIKKVTPIKLWISSSEGAVTESVKPGEKRLQKLEGTEIGDRVIML